MDHLMTAYNVMKINQVPTSSTTLDELDAIRESQAQYIDQMNKNIKWSIAIGMENCNKITLTIKCKMDWQNVSISSV